MNVYVADEDHVAVIERRASGVGSFVWVGELRTLDDRPVAAWAVDHRYANHPAQSVTHANPVSVGLSEAEVLAALVARARDLKGGS